MAKFKVAVIIGSTRDGRFVAISAVDGKPLPPATSGRDLANKLQNVA